jgi:hypothetical protein
MIKPELAIIILMLVYNSSSISSKKLRNIEIITNAPPIYLNLKGKNSIDNTPSFLLPTNIKNETIDITTIIEIMKAEYIFF